MPASLLQQEMANAGAARQDRFHAFLERFDPPLGDVDGPLSAVPIAIKDMFDVAGRTAAWGIGRTGMAAARDAAVVAQLRKSGARIAGMTVMTPLAYEPSGSNPVDGRPINPHNAERICGGSSSGSAVAVASGLVRIAMGSDTGGSLRIPAHCCGLTALKPTHGAISLEGAMPLAPSLDNIGFLADSADAIEPFARAVLLSPSAGEDFASIGFASDLAAISAPSITACFNAAVVRFNHLSVTVRAVKLNPVLEACDPSTFTLMQGEAARHHRAMLDQGQLERSLAKRLAKGLSIADGQLAAARAQLRLLRQDVLGGLLNECDAILLPVMPIETPLVAQCEFGSPDFSARTLFALSAFTRFVNAMGLPAIAFPVGSDAAGMPVALQLVGRPGAELTLLRIVQMFQLQSDAL
jgi:Asp-tRNA(Asn)/Glu-tRNA(Gln) amidotransferase A subunit family amidase